MRMLFRSGSDLFCYTFPFEVTLKHLTVITSRWNTHTHQWRVTHISRCEHEVQQTPLCILGWWIRGFLGFFSQGSDGSTDCYTHSNQHCLGTKWDPTRPSNINVHLFAERSTHKQMEAQLDICTQNNLPFRLTTMWSSFICSEDI